MVAAGEEVPADHAPGFQVVIGGGVDPGMG